jgi:hypothetical protein
MRGKTAKRTVDLAAVAAPAMAGGGMIAGRHQGAGRRLGEGRVGARLGAGALYGSRDEKAYNQGANGRYGENRS